MKKLFLISAILAVIIIVILYFLKRTKADDGSLFSSGSATAGNDTFPLKIGSRGDNVRRLQQHLNERIENANTVMAPVSPPDPLLVVDGVFGQKTEREVLRYYSVREVSKALFDQKNM